MPAHRVQQPAALLALIYMRCRDNCSPWGVEVELEGSSAVGAACAPADMAALRRITCSIARKLADGLSRGLSVVLLQATTLTAGQHNVATYGPLSGG